MQVTGYNSGLEGQSVVGGTDRMRDVTSIGGSVLQRRPCAYPKVSHFSGKDSIEDAAQFRCE